MKMSSYKTVRSTLILAAALMFAGLCFGTTIAKLNLEKLVRNAGTIFVGKCLSISEETVTGPSGHQMPCTKYTFAISKALKGGSGNTITIRQFGYRGYNPARKHQLVIPGMPSYEAGKEYILMMTKESRFGLSAPVGLAQGSFKVRYNTTTGVKEIVNGFDNAGLFGDMEASALRTTARLEPPEVRLLSQKQGAVPYKSFVSLLEKIAR